METIRITRAGEGEHLRVVTDVVTIKASGKETSGKLLVLEVVVPPGDGPPALHRHHYAEAFYILDGEFEMTTLGADETPRTERVGAGDTLAVPSLAWHNFKNVGAAPGKVLAIHSPAGMEEFAREIGEPIADLRQDERPAEPLSDAQRQKMMGIIERYMEVLPPQK